jgi:hypothetical protein
MAEPAHGNPDDRKSVQAPSGGGQPQLSASVFGGLQVWAGGFAQDPSAQGLLAQQTLQRGVLLLHFLQLLGLHGLYRTVLRPPAEIHLLGAPQPPANPWG